MAGGEAAHDELPPRPDLEQAFGAEQLQRLPDRRLRDPELVGDLRLRDDRADRQVAAQDRLADMVVRLVVQAPAGRFTGCGQSWHLRPIL